MRHHRTAQLRGTPLLRVLAHSFLRPPGFALSGRGRLPQSVAFPSSRTTPLTLRHLLCLLGPQAGSPPWRHRSPSASCRVSPSTLRGLLHLLEQSSGFQAATTGLFGDPKNKEFMTIVPEAIDELQLLNRRRVLKRAIRECIRRWKTDAVGATLARSSRRKGRQTLGWECLLGKCFREFSFCIAWLSSLYCVRGLFLCLPVAVPLVGYCSFRSPGCLDLCRVHKLWSEGGNLGVAEVALSDAPCSRAQNTTVRLPRRFLLTLRTDLEFEPQGRSSSDRLRRGHRRSASSYERVT